MKNKQPLILDRSAFTVVALNHDENDAEHWQRTTPEMRIQHLLRLRKMNYGDGASGRLQRVLEIAELQRS